MITGNRACPICKGEKMGFLTWFHHMEKFHGWTWAKLTITK